MANLTFPTETINSVIVTRAPARATAYYLVLFNKTTKAVKSSHFFKCGVSTSEGAIGGDAWTDIQAQVTTLGLTGLPCTTSHYHVSVELPALGKKLVHLLF